MKKSIIGFIFGLVLATSVSSFAETFYQFMLSKHSLYVDDIKIEQPMFIKDGTNYIPLRAVSETLGADVEYKNGRIDIKKPLTDLETVVKNCKDSCVMIYAYKDNIRSQGSGFIYNGYIITAKHVVEGMEKIYVYFDDSKLGKIGEIVPIETSLDVAVLKTNTTNPSVVLGDSDKLKEGEKLVAITSPHGTQNMIDECTYSGKVITVAENHLGLSDTIMTNGSSGGAIFNYNSELIGMAFKGIDGIIGAIPINDIKPILEQFNKN